MIDQLPCVVALITLVYFLAGLALVVAYNANVWIPTLSDNRKIRITTRCLMFLGWPIFLVSFVVHCAISLLRAIWHEIIF